MRYLNVEDEAESPDVWHALAQAGTKQDMRVLQDRARDFALSNHAYIVQPTVISSQLCQDIASLTFHSTSPENVKTGLSPFAVAYESDDQREAMIANAKTYMHLNEGTMGMSLQDWESLKAKDVKHVPTTFFALETCLGSYGNLLGMLLGPQHEVCRAYKTFWNLWQRHRIVLNNKVGTGLRLQPIHVLLKVQGAAHYYFEARTDNQIAVPPKFADIVQKIVHDEFTMPTIPSMLQVLSGPPAPIRDQPLPVLPIANAVVADLGGDKVKVTKVYNPKRDPALEKSLVLVLNCAI